MIASDHDHRVHKLQKSIYDRDWVVHKQKKILAVNLQKQRNGVA